MLYPEMNEARTLLDLGGVWAFQTAQPDGWPGEWANRPLPDPITMAVPAAYNDQKDDVNLRAHYGWAVYYARINAELDKRPFFIGEQAWHFADFSTIQGPMRVDGNKKGLLTRDRRPKLAAHYFRKRWHSVPDYNYKP